MCPAGVAAILQNFVEGVILGDGHFKSQKEILRKQHLELQFAGKPLNQRKVVLAIARRSATVWDFRVAHERIESSGDNGFVVIVALLSSWVRVSQNTFSKLLRSAAGEV